ncbi:MAG: NPCBM/NEW2 domain-containing protein [Pseudoflavonifractor sp.]|nr:NPCBM/NEW2 domain-containing protein [Alloprevotella sp.]MCM1116262.1 NPCBM/NEW2 domain-containing protein [Pseudoflavonifractor sp.]
MRKNLLFALTLPALGLALSAMAAVTVPAPSGSGIVELSSLDLSKITCFDDAGKTKVRANEATLGGPIVMKDTTYTSGIGTHAPSQAFFRLNGASRFQASLGIDDGADLKANHGIVDYEITLYKGSAGEVVKSGTIKRDDPASVKLNLDLKGYDFMQINLKQGAQAWADHVDLGNAFFSYSGEKPVTITEAELGSSSTVTPEPPSGIVQLPAQGTDGAEIVPLSSLDLANATVGWGSIKANKSIDNKTLTLKGTEYASGVGTHATSRIVVKLNGSVTKFHTVCGIDDEVSQNGQVKWKVWLLGEAGKQQTVAEGTAKRSDDKATEVTADCFGWKYLILDADQDGADSYDHFDWANAYFEFIQQNSNPPATVPVSTIEGGLDCATTYFASPGVRMMHFIRANNPDAAISVSGLPAGLSYDARRQAVTGIVDSEGEYSYTISVENLDGDSEEFPVHLTVSKSLQMPTPMMGWLSWNVVQDKISAEVIRQVADAMVSTGLAEAGYNSLVIDDLWHASARNADRSPKEDPAKFPNGMKASADYVHAKGLRFGIYSDGGTRTCGGAFGSFGYETEDANQYAKWGVDILKYDYCNAPSDLATTKARFKAMADALKASGRDIVLYVCEWGQNDPWKWGAEIGAPFWRTTLDARDCWIARSPGVGVSQSIELIKDLWPYSGPNRFNDADMMCLGIHGTGKSSSDLCQTGPGMTQDEYRTQMSLWCMWSSALSLTCDLRKPISDDDLAIMTNKELIAINQDPMGLQAQYLGDFNGMKLFAKDLENGDVAIAVVNLNASAGSFSLDFDNVPALTPGARYHFRDLWAHEDLGVKDSGFRFDINSHATRVFRLTDEASFNAIESIAADAFSTLSVASSGSALDITIPASAGIAKRIIVSDLSGRVVGVANASTETVTIPVNAAPGSVLMVRAVAQGNALSAKTIL